MVEAYTEDDVAIIERLIEVILGREEVQNFLRSHGSTIALEDVDPATRVVKLDMRGGCDGCDSQRDTLTFIKKTANKFLREKGRESLEIADVVKGNEDTGPKHDRFANSPVPLSVRGNERP